MSDVMQGIEQDVPFDHGVCNGLETACRAAASAIEGQTASRASYVTTAMQEFRGRFSELFTANADVAKADATELANRLREIATAAADLQASARAEQQRRETARQWKQEQDDRDWLEQGHDWMFGGDEPPVGPPDPAPQLAISPPVNGTRETPNPGSGGGGGGGGTSSARPADLRSFATGSQSLDSNLGWRPSSLRSRLSDFAAQCQWGRLDASGVMTGFDAWLDANGRDVTWAQTVADAFAAAGGEGAVSTLSDASLMAALQAAGVDATRDDIVIDPAIAVGNPPTTGYANDPVNTSTGNFIENEVDLAFTGGAAALAWARTYNSFDDHVGAFGPGWSSACEVRLELGDEGAALVLEDGRHVVFARSGEGWERATGENRWLAREERDGRTVLVATDNAGERTDFTTSGTWLATSRGAGTRVEAAYDDRGRLVGLSHERGRSVELRWDGDRVVEALSSDGRRIVYGYDNAGRLTSARGPLGTRTYGWTDPGAGAGLVERVIDADGVVEAENTYDDQRRVATQRSHFGRLTRFAYLPGRVTVTSDQDGSRSNTWVSDGRGRVVGIVDAEDHRQSMAYDGHGNLVSATERDGAVTVHRYDERGRRVRSVTPTGADVAYGYDELDRVTTVSAESGTVTMEYAGDGRDPSAVVDPEGGRSELVWRDGLLARVLDPVGVTIDLEHDDHGDLVAVTDALGHTARLERDDAGRVVASTMASGARTTFTYDGAGLLLARRDPDGAEWRFEHTTAGRLLATVDPLGARTEMERGDHGETVATTDPLGRIVSRVLDDLGHVTEARLPDGSTWQFAHDALSRLVEVVDPAGATWTREYTAGGALAGLVDPDGVRRDVTADRRAGTVTVREADEVSMLRFDALGRPVASHRPDGSAAMATHDRCGRVVEMLDAEGGLTLLRRDAAGKVVEHVTPSGATTRYEYDAAGRLAATIDPSGARTQLERDADGRVVRTVMPTGDAVVHEHDPCGRVLRRVVPGRGTTRYRYDRCGRVVEVRDPWHGHRRFRYDPAGQLVEVVNGVGGVTRLERDAVGRVVAIVDPLGRATRRVLDPRGLCTAETDPLGRTTRAGYDAVGRQVWQEDPTGRRLEMRWEQGRLVSTSVDGTEVMTRSADLRGRTVTVRESGVEHRLVHDRRGLLVARHRGDRTTTWTYDVDGRRASMTTPDGHRTDYGYDDAGRLAWVEHPVLGRAELDRDAGGRVVRARAGGAVATWEHEDGFVVRHVVQQGDGTEHVVSVSRDDDGRVGAVEVDGARTAYEHDDAGRLVRVASGGSSSTWEYDASGRLLAEVLGGNRRELVRDAAGQLLEETDDRGTVRHAYDDLGRRVRTERPDGSVRELVWDPVGWLGSVVDQTAGGEERRLEVRVDALGELASVGGDEVVLDTAATHTSPPVMLGGAGVLVAGPLTGVGQEWSVAGWRAARSTQADPWDLPGAVGPAGTPAQVGVGGELLAAGLEWLGARVYDPTSKGFLSVDPLDPVLGSGWAGDPYSYAGHDPLHSLDPTGLRPVTEEELQAYIDANQGKWEYVAAGAMVVGGLVCMATGFGGPLGLVLIGAGTDLAMQRMKGKDINWGQVGLAGALGAVPGVNVLSRGAMPLARATASPVANAMARGAVNGAVTGARDGFITANYGYFTGDGPHSGGDYFREVGLGTLEGAGTGGLGNSLAEGADMGGQALMSNFRANRLLGDADNTVVIGAQSDTTVLAGQSGTVVQRADDWHPNLTNAFQERAIDQRMDIYEATDDTLTYDQFDRMVDDGYDIGSDTYTYVRP